MPISFNARALAARHLVRLAEIEASLTGAIMVEVLEPAPSGLSALTRPISNKAQGWPLEPMVAAMMGAMALALCLLGLVAGRRRSRQPDIRLIRQARIAQRAIRRETHRLGPVFDDVLTSSRQLLVAAVSVRQSCLASRKAARRTRHLDAAAAKVHRQELHQKQLEALERLRTLVEQMEETASRLATYGVSNQPQDSATKALQDLRHEMNIVLAADAEAREYLSG